MKYIKVISKVTLSFTLYPLFQWYSQIREILLNLNMKCWNSAFYVQGSRLIIVLIQVGAVKIYVATMKRKKRGDETEFATKIGGKTSLGPPYLVLYNFIPS